METQIRTPLSSAKVNSELVLGRLEVDWSLQFKFLSYGSGARQKPARPDGEQQLGTKATRHYNSPPTKQKRKGCMNSKNASHRSSTTTARELILFKKVTHFWHSMVHYIQESMPSGVAHKFNAIQMQPSATQFERQPRPLKVYALNEVIIRKGHLRRRSIDHNEHNCAGQSEQQGRGGGGKGLRGSGCKATA